MLASITRKRNASLSALGLASSRVVSLSNDWRKVSGLVVDPVWMGVHDWRHRGYTTGESDWHSQVHQMLASKARERHVSPNVYQQSTRAPRVAKFLPAKHESVFETPRRAGNPARTCKSKTRCRLWRVRARFKCPPNDRQQSTKEKARVR